MGAYTIETHGTGFWFEKTGEPKTRSFVSRDFAASSMDKTATRPEESYVKVIGEGGGGIIIYLGDEITIDADPKANTTFEELLLIQQYLLGI